ncbi:uncharacterized protein LOC131235647 [Magnolia sinica]|uniref:uncharacterized protein LOC131235647 n=1 Tax=Magnolia sinica TaxID=86752 RepID=UPI00265AC211|nr:uncharacterized protein LOC131235647 [Magnolia sinica]
MPFALKNAGATYQRLVNQMFAKQISRTMEVYVDDMLVKSVRASDHIIDLRETSILREYRMKLNLVKCAFRVGLDKFLDFQVSQRSIEQLKGHKKAKWTLECEQAFQQLKQYLGSPPLLSKLEEGELLFLYLAVSASGVSSALIRDVGGRQHPIYYVSKVVVPTKTRQILQKPEVSSRLIKWVIELREFDIQYRPEITINGQAVVDFIVKFTTSDAKEADASAEAVPVPLLSPWRIQDAESKQKWILYVDKSLNFERVEAGIVLLVPDTTFIQYAIGLGFKASNNEAEYEALLAGLRLAASLGVQSLKVKVINKVIKHHLKTKLEITKGNWVEELSFILWVYRTTTQSSTGETPFSLSYGSKAIIPVEIDLPTAQVRNYREDQNTEQIAANLDLLEEVRDVAKLRVATQHQQVAWFYNSRVKTRRFRLGDLVLCRVFQNTADPGARTLGTNWEGPYRVVRSTMPGSYHLEDLRGRQLPHS